MILGTVGRVGEMGISEEEEEEYAVVRKAGVDDVCEDLMGMGRSEMRCEYVGGMDGAAWQQAWEREPWLIKIKAGELEANKWRK